MKITKQTIIDAIYGVAIGDAVGVPFEFKSVATMRAESPCKDMTGYGTFNLPEGTFSDDTSMTLAALEGIAEMQSETDYAAIMNKFCMWLDSGEYTVNGVFDVGNVCMKAIRKFRKGYHAHECGGMDVSDNGNGSLMRIMPSVLYSLIKYGKIDDSLITHMSALTHGHCIATTACIIYAKIAQFIIEHPSEFDVKMRAESLHKVIINVDIPDNADAAEAFARIRNKEFCSLPINAIDSSGYVIHSLEAAVWCLANTDRYRDCILKAVNLGGDTDTTAAIAGGLAGLFYGVEGIPKTWVEKLRGKDIIDKAIHKFFTIIYNYEGV